MKIESRVEGGFGSDNGSDEDGKNGTGGGWGGQGDDVSGKTAGAGGSGIVIIRFKYTKILVSTLQTTGF